MSDPLSIRYRTAHKALPPQPIRLKVPGWGGSPAMKMENGSEPQPWHCLPFVEASTCGFELLYQYESECHVINDGGDVRIEWDYRNEPGGIAGPDEFSLNAPKPALFYSFGTSIDLEVPRGYVLRTSPHPRFYTDATFTVPAALAGHVQTEWWPKKLFVVFKVPPPGFRHIFRKGDPYVQILVVPEKQEYELSPMSPEREAQRRRLDDSINLAKPYIAKNVWHNEAGSEFSDHYKVLSRTYARDGMEAVEKAVESAVNYRHQTLPSGKTLREYLDLAERFQSEGKLVEAKEIYFRLCALAPDNAEVARRSGLLSASMGLVTAAQKLLARAVALQPQSPACRHDLGEILRRLGRYQEAEASFRAALGLRPDDPQAMSNLGLSLAQQGRPEEATECCRRALRAGPSLPVVHYRMGSVLAICGSKDEARSAFESALALDPNFAPARSALSELTAEPPRTRG